MLASARPVPVRSRRGLVRGSVLGLGVLVAGSAAASPALAEEIGEPEAIGPEPVAQPVELTATAGPLVEAPEWTPSSPVGAAVPTADFGNQKTLTVSLTAPAGAPSDLSLAGNVFDLVRGDGSIAAQCTTTHAGTCSFWSSVQFSFQSHTASNAEIAAGRTYTLRQSARSAGLARMPGDLGRVYICGFDCNSGRWAYYTPDSLFRNVLEGFVVDADSEDAVAGTTFELTGPGYPRSDGTPASESRSWGTATSDEDGLVSWSGSFLPGGYAVAPVEDPAGALSGDPAAFDLAAWNELLDEPQILDVGVRYVREVVEPEDPEPEIPGPVVVDTPQVGGTGDGGGQPAGTGGAGTGGGTGAGVVTPNAGARIPAAPVAPAADAPVAQPTAGAVTAPTTAAPRPSASPSAPVGQRAEPQLETASADTIDLRVVGLGALFLGVVGGGMLLLLVMRRRARGY